jgi:hypothetical protein
MNGYCPIPGCSETPGREQLMCRMHWFRVPPALRAKVWSAWHRRKTRPEDTVAAREHRDACDEAIARVTGALA